MDRDGKVVIPAGFRVVGQFSEGLAYAESAGAGGYIDKTGEFVIPAQFAIGGEFRKGLAAINMPGFGYFIDRTGKIPAQFVPAKFKVDAVGTFSEGLAAIQQDGRWGYVDLFGRIVITPQWHEVEEFRDGIARVKGPDGYINTRGKYIWKAKGP